MFLENIEKCKLTMHDLMLTYSDLERCFMLVFDFSLELTTFRKLNSF